MTDGNVEQPNEEIKVRGHSRKKPQQGEHSRIQEPRVQGRPVRILGGGQAEGVSVESKHEGGSLETQVELGGPGTDPRDGSGRRVFRKS
jgi:hypothetical protein